MIPVQIYKSGIIFVISSAKTKGNEMKCPYCGEELKEWDRRLYCENMACSANHEDLPEFIWQDLIDGKKARQQLRTIKDCCVKKVKAKEREIATYVNGISVREGEIERLAKQLRQTHDALEVATNYIKWTIDTFEKGLERETDIGGYGEIVLEKTNKIITDTKE